ncbi:MAG: hypothetical protein OXT65_12810 [Alphaproteobacteria bacterium]|nr:hypothetical protein [Alphaproteobacteria bacterium]
MVHEDLLSKNPEYKRLSDISDMQDTVIILLNFSKRDYDAWISENADAKTPNANNARYLMAHINEFKESMASATQRLDQSYSKAPQP